MGAVYAAEDDVLRRRIALKVVRPDLAKDPDRRRRLLQEARAAAAVSHPNVLSIYEVGEEDGLVYIAMEYVEGPSLREELLAGPLALGRVLRIGSGIARALARAHDAGVIHRDLKPDNVLLVDGDHPKVVDFGLAHHDGAGEEAGATLEGRVFGTPGYLSPEQARGWRLDHRTDLFSIGVVLYEMTTGRRPFTGVSALDQLAAVMRDRPPPPHTLRPDTPPALDALIEQLMSKNPVDRPEDARTVAATLDAISSGSPSTAVPVSVTRDAALAQPTLTPSTLGDAAFPTMAPPSIGPTAVPVTSPAVTTATPAPSANPVPRRRRWPWAIAAAAPLLLTLAAIGWHRHTTPVPLTALPNPAKGAIAQADWAAAMQYYRDGDDHSAQRSLGEAVKEEPGLGSAFLHLAIHQNPERAREPFQKAVALRAAMDDRDRAVLDAVAPRIQASPPDPALAASQLGVASDARPTDAEIAWVWGNAACGSGDLAAAVSALTRATTIVPEYASAYADLADSQAYRGDLDAGRATVDHCVAVAANTVRCRHSGIRILDQQGQCAAVEDLARGWMAASPADQHPELIIADALLARGRPVAAAKSMLDSHIQLMDPTDQSTERAAMDAELAAFAGDFETARARALVWQSAVAQEPLERDHAGPARLLVDVEEELGDEAAAADVAAEYLSRRDGWTPELRSTDIAILREPVPYLLAVEHRAGRRDDASLATAVTAWVDGWTAHTPPFWRRWLWVQARVLPARNAAEATTVGKDELPPFVPNTLAVAAWGRVQLLQGDAKAALPSLERGVTSCLPLADPIGWVRAWDDLGAARETTGDAAGACKAYAQVTSRWSAPSLTAVHALAREIALACPP